MNNVTVGVDDPTAAQSESVHPQAISVDAGCPGVRRGSLSAADTSVSSVSDYKRLHNAPSEDVPNSTSPSPHRQLNHHQSSGTSNPVVILLVFSAVNTFIYFDRGLFAVSQLSLHQKPHLRCLCIELFHVHSGHYELDRYNGWIAWK